MGWGQSFLLPIFPVALGPKRQGALALGPATASQNFHASSSQASCLRGVNQRFSHPFIGAAAMARSELSKGIQAAVECLNLASRPRFHPSIRCPQRTFVPSTRSRYLSTTPSRRVGNDNTPTLEPVSQNLEPFTAAPPIDFSQTETKNKASDETILSRVRVVPASPSYFSAKPTFTDDYINLSALLRKTATLPTVTAAEAPKVAWKTIDQYRIMTNEPVKTQRYHKMMHIVRRLNCIHPTLIPEEVVEALKRYKKDSQPGDIVPPPGVIDEWGRARGVGRRKTSSAVAFVVEGEGEVMINGQSLITFFRRLHLRESAVWALKATNRLDKYNVFGRVTGGGMTGQAEALTLAVAKALLVHEPALKPALRRGELDPAKHHPPLWSTLFHLFPLLLQFPMYPTFPATGYPLPVSTCLFQAHVGSLLSHVFGTSIPCNRTPPQIS